MRVELDDEELVLRMGVGEYRAIMGGLRELLAEMHEGDFMPRLGIKRQAMSELAQEFYDQSVRLGVEE